MRFTPRLADSNIVASLGVALGAFVVATLLQRGGLLETLDLAADDRAMQLTSGAKAEARFAIVLESEADLARWGFPLSDGVLAELLERIGAAGPVAIAVDKYRDKPVGPGTERLDRLLANSDRIYWAAKFGETGKDAIPAPASLNPRFVGCADLLADPDGNLRRALLYLDAGESVCYSLAFQLARHALASAGDASAFGDDGPSRLRLGRGTLQAIDPGDGPYASADTAGFQVWAPSAAGLPAMKTLTLADVLDRDAAKELRGRVVLFGSAADSLHDFFDIPAPGLTQSRVKIAGVQAHALVASHLLRVANAEATPLRLLPGAASLALALVLALGAAIIACSRHKPWVVLSGGAALFAIYLAFVLAMAPYGLYIAPMAAAVALALALAAGIARGAWLDSRERGELMLIFSRHVSREVADALWERRDRFISSGAIRPLEVTATVLFVDIRGFTSVTEQLAAERAVPWLNRGLAAMTEEIMKHEGVVARFIGDSIMAVFGAPIPRDTREGEAADAFNAVSAGLAMGEALDQLNREFSAEGLPPIRVRVGINTGRITQCSVGTYRRMEFTVLGDAVNTASRLESFAMEDDGATARVLIGESTMELAGGRFRTRLVGSMGLKGKETPVTIHQVLSQ